VQQVMPYVLVIVMFVLVLVQHIAVQQMLRPVLATVPLVLVLVQHIAVQQLQRPVLVTVILVLALVQHIAVQQVMPYVLVTVTPVLVLVQHIAVQQVTAYVLATVTPVLVLVQYITVQQMSAYVLETVMFVLVLVQHIAVQQAMLYVQIQLPLVVVQAVAQCLIVGHALTLMVYADIQRVVVILVATWPIIMAVHVQLVNIVAVDPVFLLRQVPMATVALLLTIVATEAVPALHLLTPAASCTARRRMQTVIQIAQNHITPGADYPTTAAPDRLTA